MQRAEKGGEKEEEGGNIAIEKGQEDERCLQSQRKGTLAFVGSQGLSSAAALQTRP